jgi:hypothetical protein
MRTLCLILLLAPPALAAAVAPDPTLQLAGAKLTAQGLTPGGQVVWFGLSRETADYAERIVPLAAMGQADSQGRAQLTLVQPPARLSLWMAVDLATAGAALAPPAGGGLRELPGGAFRVAPGSGAADRLEDAAAEAIEVLWVRPGTGAWTLEMAADSPRNLGAAGSPLQFALDQMRPLGASPAAPSHVAAGDKVLVIHPRRMELARTTIGVAP